MVIRTSRSLVILALALALGTPGCLSPGGGTAPEDRVDGASDVDVSPDDCDDTALIEYRDDLAVHPGCSTEGLAYPAAVIPGYPCAAKAYPVVDEDPKRPIVLLVHGNSDGTGGWESFENPACDPAGSMQGQPMLAERLSAAGYRVYAVDMRSDRTPLTGADPDDCMGPTCNTAHSMDHGWGVPIVMRFFRAILEAYPDRQVSLVGHSFGVTVIRDALRRMDLVEGAPVWPRIDQVILLSGGNHGVSEACGYAECRVNTTMRGRAACQIGNRNAWSPNCWSHPLHGVAGAWEVPCADGDSAYGRSGVCDGHRVAYTTIVMSDLENGAQQDLCVSEQASMLHGADNRTIALTSFDESDYFLCGVLKNHFGSQRSVEAMAIILERLAQ
jgi:pimeloyl-ACP methyl ester carboxylesterase